MVPYGYKYVGLLSLEVSRSGIDTVKRTEWVDPLYVRRV